MIFHKAAIGHDADQGGENLRRREGKPEWVQAENIERVGRLHEDIRHTGAENLPDVVSIDRSFRRCCKAVSAHDDGGENLSGNGGIGRARDALL